SINETRQRGQTEAPAPTTLNQEKSRPRQLRYKLKKVQQSFNMARVAFCKAFYPRRGHGISTSVLVVVPEVHGIQDYKANSKFVMLPLLGLRTARINPRG